MRECSYSAALSMKSALRCKKNKCSAFSKHRLDKKWRMLLFGRISAFFTTGSSISTMFLSNLPSDNLRARAIAWKSFGGLVNFSAGLHLIDQLGKGSEQCNVCEPFAYSRALRLLPRMTLYTNKRWNCWRQEWIIWYIRNNRDINLETFNTYK